MGAGTKDDRDIPSDGFVKPPDRCDARRVGANGKARNRAPASRRTRFVTIGERTSSGNERRKEKFLSKSIIRGHVKSWHFRDVGRRGTNGYESVRDSKNPRFSRDFEGSCAHLRTKTGTTDFAVRGCEVALSGRVMSSAFIALMDFDCADGIRSMEGIMTKRPLIGITTDTHDKPNQYESPCGYSTSVERAGGLPVLLPYKVDVSLVAAYVDSCDGIILSGGNDIDPATYGDAPYHPKAAPIDPLRQRFEMALLAEIERRRKPVLGICLGSQMMNVYRGGSLYQHLPDLDREGKLEHGKLEEGRYPRHAVNVEADSILGNLWHKREVLANSSHKQAVRQLGKGLRVIATSADGVIEATEDATFPLWLGVQWHPERLSDEEDHLRIFKLLVERSTR